MLALSQEVGVARWRRPGVNEILLVFLLLGAIGFICSWLSHSSSPQNPLWPFLSTAFLAWRVSRGGRISRMILVIGSGVTYAGTALAVARCNAIGRHRAVWHQLDERAR